MDAETLEALKGSITKWELIVSGEMEDNGAFNCPLCLHFADCEDGCPVNNYTHNGCQGSPYGAWHHHHECEHSHFESPFSVECPTCLTLAQAELDFLKSLLPKEDSNVNQK